jgi:sensor histidine kinase YesM
MIAFENSKLIFSDEKKYRIRRHLLFWSFWGFYFGLIRELSPRYLLLHGHFNNPVKVMAESFIFLLPHAVLIYCLLYFILPHYIFNEKYIKATICIILLLLLVFLISAVLIIGIAWHKVGLFMEFEKATWSGKLTMPYLNALQGSLGGAALAASFKMFKHYYVKDIRNQQLMKENIAAQLQVLKAQVHPHFLFNTLNNIYSQTQLESPKGSKMIMGLSDILRYILYEGQKPLVPLKQELLMMIEYIHLEKIRYGNKLDVHVLTPDKADDFFIAPLLLLPFVENCFKHGANNRLQNPWINLNVELKDMTIVMKLMNGKLTARGNGQHTAGIGINNVRQRLELLYKDKYDLQIREDEEVFVVDLRIELTRMENKKEVEDADLSRPEIVYTN